MDPFYINFFRLVRRQSRIFNNDTKIYQGNRSLSTYETRQPSLSRPTLSRRNRTTLPSFGENATITRIHSSYGGILHASTSCGTPKARLLAQSLSSTPANGHQNIFAFFDNISTIPKTRKSFKMALGYSAYPKTVFASSSRAASRQAAMENPTTSTDKQYVSVGVGEDAFFRRENAIGVADGVGGWSRVKGANPALYSRKLMHYACLEIAKAGEDDGDLGDLDSLDPKVVLQRSYDQVSIDVEKEILVGSTTACIVILCDDELRVANLGDGGVVVVRGEEIIFRTEEQQHSFNFPFQLGTGSKDSPADAESFSIKVQEGDVIVVASDGLFDNVFDDEIVTITSEVTKGKKPNMIDPQMIADQLALRCREVQEDPMAVASPFQVKAVEEGLYFEGGKQDDVTLVVGLVLLNEDSPSRRAE